MLTTRPVAAAVFVLGSFTAVSAADLAGVTVTPYVIADAMQYRRPRMLGNG